MKHLYIIGGTMGVGKTTTCQHLKAILPKCAFLDGDWCWDMHPFVVTEETKAMVLDNICHVLQNFIQCSAYDNIILGWVLHQQDTIDALLARLDIKDCTVHNISLVCSPKALTKRLQKDIVAGMRQPDVLARSLDRLPLYEKLHTYKLDVSHISAQDAAGLIKSKL